MNPYGLFRSAFAVSRLITSNIEPHDKFFNEDERHRPESYQTDIEAGKLFLYAFIVECAIKGIWVEEKRERTEGDAKIFSHRVWDCYQKLTPDNQKVIKNIYNKLLETYEKNKIRNIKIISLEDALIENSKLVSNFKYSLGRYINREKNIIIRLPKIPDDSELFIKFEKINDIEIKKSSTEEIEYQLMPFCQHLNLDFSKELLQYVDDEYGITQNFGYIFDSVDMYFVDIDYDGNVVKATKYEKLP